MGGLPVYTRTDGHYARPGQSLQSFQHSLASAVQQMIVREGYDIDACTQQSHGCLWIDEVGMVAFLFLGLAGQRTFEVGEDDVRTPQKRHDRCERIIGPELADGLP